VEPTDTPRRTASARQWLASAADLTALVYLTALTVAAFAFVVSYSHIYDLGREHAQAGTAGRILPLSVDLVIVAASLVMFRQSRQGRELTGLERWLPRIVLWTGIGATVAANVAYGLPHGWLAAVISGWPGAAFVGVVEMVMVAVRPAAGEAVKETLKTAGQPLIPGSAYEAARIAHAASVQGGNPLTEYTLHKRFGISRGDARKIVAPASLNGSGAGG
jgi:predicted membrane protein